MNTSSSPMPLILISGRSPKSVLGVTSSKIRIEDKQKKDKIHVCGQKSLVSLVNSCIEKL
jgi:hypothetical protein